MQIKLDVIFLKSAMRQTLEISSMIDLYLA